MNNTYSPPFATRPKAQKVPSSRFGLAALEHIEGLQGVHLMINGHPYRDG